MRLAVYLCISCIFILIAGKKLIRYPLPFYVGVVILSIFIPASEAGPLTGALFTLVMFAGAFPPGSFAAKTFMPVRAQLSIGASIVALSHSFYYGSYYLSKVLLDAAGLSISTAASLIISFLLLLVMLPLFITSFKFIRKKMDAKKWKKLQRMAYVFYALTFLHIMAFEMPKARSGNIRYLLNVSVYFIVFASYLFCRIFRSVYKAQKNVMARLQLIATTFIFAITALFNIVFYHSPAVAGARRDKVPDTVLEQASLEGSSYIDGTYYGEGEGNNGMIKVSVTVKDSVISDISIISFPDDPEYFDQEKDGNRLIGQILEKQSPEVDTITGATYSSEGVIKAVQNALTNAQ